MTKDLLDPVAQNFVDAYHAFFNSIAGLYARASVYYNDQCRMKGLAVDECLAYEDREREQLKELAVDECLAYEDREREQLKELIEKYGVPDD